MSENANALAKAKAPSLWEHKYRRSPWAAFDMLSLLQPFKFVHELHCSVPLREYSSQVWRCLMPRRKSLLDDLPNEMILEIFTHMGWRDILACRKTSKRLFEISTSRPLWVFLFQRLSSELMMPPVIERPISAYSAQELERIVLKRISSESAFAAAQPAKVQIVPVAPTELDDRFHLLEGGRWLLMTSPKFAGRVHAYDLDKAFPQEPQCIIDLSYRNPKQFWWIKSDLDRTETSLAYNLCLVPFSTTRKDLTSLTNNNPDQSTNSPTNFYIYRLTFEGHGSEATLVAHRLRMLYAGSGPYTQELAFHGHYLARRLGDLDSDMSCIEICNWFLSDFSSCLKSYILPDHKCICEFSPLPDRKFLLVSGASAALYDITKLHTIPRGKDDREEALQPYWRHEDPHIYFDVYLSRPYCDFWANTTRIAIAARGSIYGMVIPRNNDEPWYQRLCENNLEGSAKGFIGINKTYAHGKRLKLTTTTFLWPQDKEEHDGFSLIQPAVRSFTCPSLYKPSILPPLLDERSNRAFAVGCRLWTIVEYAVD